MDIFLRRRKLGFKSCKRVARLLSENGYNIRSRRNDKIRGFESFSTVVRWGVRSRIDADIIINRADHIALCNDKARCRYLLMENNISIPRTFFNKFDVDTFPIIGRERYHHQGRRLKFIRTREELLSDYSSDYWSEFIPKDREYRIFTFFSKILGMVEKIPESIARIAWNRYGGNSKFYNIRWNNWDLSCAHEALKASRMIGIDFSGVDVISKDGTPYILEINSAPSLTTEYRQEIFKRGFAWALDYIRENGEKPSHFDLVDPDNYKDLILPKIIEASDEGDC